MDTRFNPQLKLAVHTEFARFQQGQRVVPINIEVSLTHVCQAKCPWCFYRGTHQKMKPESVLDFDVCKQLLQDMTMLGVKAVTWTGGGEPTLHPRFGELVNAASSLKLNQGLFTNGLDQPDYDPSLLDWIRVSNTDESWNEDVLSYIRQRAKVLGMAVNYVGDDDTVKNASEIGNRVGVDYVQVRQALKLRGHVTDREPPRSDDPLLFVTKYKFDDSPNPHGYTKCYGFNFVPYVWHDGDVDVCGYQRKKGFPYTLGNLHKQRLAQILLEAPRHVPVISSCQVCCKNNEINKMINKANDLKDAHFV